MLEYQVQLLLLPSSRDRSRCLWCSRNLRPMGYGLHVSREQGECCWKRRKKVLREALEMDSGSHAGEQRMDNRWEFAVLITSDGERDYWKD